MTLMHALVKDVPCPGLSFKEVPIPTLGNLDVLIKIKITAICGTDLHIYNWDPWAQQTLSLPLILGHEFMGVVEAVGNDVTQFKPGDRVSGEGHISCGFCRNCRNGKEHVCLQVKGLGIQRSGAFAHYLCLPAHNVIKLPSDIPDEIGAILDPLGDSLHTALAFDLIGEDVLITGAGPVGLMAVAIAKKVGARKIVISDINEYRLDLAKKLGVTHAFNVSHSSLLSILEEKPLDTHFSVGLEMSGSIDSVQDLLNAILPGGNIAVLGVPIQKITLDLNTLIFKGLTLKGIYGRQMFRTWQKMIDLLQAGLDVSSVITHHFPAKDFQQAFDVANRGQAGKVLLYW